MLTIASPQLACLIWKVGLMNTQVGHPNTQVKSYTLKAHCKVQKQRRFHENPSYAFLLGSKPPIVSGAYSKESGDRIVAWDIFALTHCGSSPFNMGQATNSANVSFTLFPGDWQSGETWKRMPGASLCLPAPNSSCPPQPGTRGNLATFFPLGSGVNWGMRAKDQGGQHEKGLTVRTHLDVLGVKLTWHPDPNITGLKFSFTLHKVAIELPALYNQFNLGARHLLLSSQGCHLTYPRRDLLFVGNHWLEMELLPLISPAPLSFYGIVPFKYLCEGKSMLFHILTQI